MKEGEKQEVRSMNDNKFVGEEDHEPRTWTKRMKLPILKDVDLQGGITRVEILFEVQNMSTKDRLRLTFINMDDNISKCFQFLRRKSKNPSWEEFSDTMIRRFRVRKRSSNFERLAKVNQQGNTEN